MEQTKILSHLLLDPAKPQKANTDMPLLDATKGANNKSGSNPISFQAKVRENQAKLAANSAKAQSRTLDTVSDKQANANKNDSQIKSPNEKLGKSQKSDRQGSRPRNDKAIGQKNPKIQSVQNVQNDSETNQTNLVSASKNQPNQTEANTQNEMAPNDQAENALRNRLEKMGVHASDEQLSDPSFLKEMLQFLQNIAPSSVETSSSDNQAVATTEIIPSAGKEEKATANPTLPEMDLAANKNSLKDLTTQVNAQKDLVDLIKVQLVALSQKADSQNQNGTAAVANNVGNSSANGINSKSWSGLRMVGKDETVTTNEMPKADLDRLRVLQAAAFQAGQRGEASQTEGQIDSIVTDTDGKSDIAAIHSVDSAEHSPSNHATGSEQENLDQNHDPSKTRGTELPAQNNANLNLKDTASAPQFHHALEQQLRGTDARLESERVWAPHQTAFDQNLLHQISKKMNALAHLNGEEISIQLEPENLGKIRVGVGMKDGVMTARIGVETESVRQVVEANLATLRDSLENQGIKIQGMEVTVDQRHSSLFNPNGNNSESFFHQRGQGGSENGFKNQELSGLDSVPESDTGRRLGYNTMEFIG